MTAARNTLPTPSPDAIPAEWEKKSNDELNQMISLNIAALQNTQYADLINTAKNVQKDITEKRHAIYSEDARRIDYVDLLQSTELLRQREQNDWALMQMGSRILRNDTGQHSRAWKKFGTALLAFAGATLFITGTLALCSGLGALPGSFVASAGTWLLGVAGLAQSSAAAIGVSTVATIAGATAWGSAIYLAHGLFRPSPRESYQAKITTLAHGPKMS